MCVPRVSGFQNCIYVVWHSVEMEMLVFGDMRIDHKSSSYHHTLRTLMQCSFVKVNIAVFKKDLLLKHSM